MREFVVPNGMPRAIFENKYSRRKPDGTFQTWAERVREVVTGNFMLDPRWNQPSWAGYDALHRFEYPRMTELAVAGVMPFSGRHMQHGDEDQPNKRMELFTNCATTCFSFMMFRLLLNGAGVGRDYSTATCRVDWSNMPNVRLVLDDSHPDFKPDLFRGFMEPLREARHKYDSESEAVRWFTVEDSREGWAKVVEILETAAWQEKHEEKLFIFDFSQIRCEGSPIMGLQGRPATGPITLMNAIACIANVKTAGMKPWKQAMFIDNHLASCVQLGGARRAARMATKHWRDRDVIEFIDIKRGGFLQFANDSILVDAEFWSQASKPQHSHARRVFEAAVNAGYWDKTGEPGFINVDQLVDNSTGLDNITGQDLISSDTYPDLHHRTKTMVENILGHLKSLPYHYIVNPCGEIVLATWGGYCLVGDVCLANAESLTEAIDAVKLMARFLVRTNLMKCDFRAETSRTNRIGVSLCGVHEFAFVHFGLDFRQLVSYDYTSAHPAYDFWQFIDRLREHAEHSAKHISQELSLVTPHTVTTAKPGGTIPKVMACTDGISLPSLAYYLRWVQYKIGDPEITDLMARGYPMKDVSHRYAGHVVIGFPTHQRIADLMSDRVVTAGQVSISDHYRWLRLFEEHWLGTGNNQLSYTLNYNSADTTYPDYMQIILDNQPYVRCCSVMPQDDWQVSAQLYSYVPEEPISKVQYEEYIANIDLLAKEAYDEDGLACASGACPIESDLA